MRDVKRVLEAEKLLRVTGAASTRANWATPQLVGTGQGLRGDSRRRHKRRNGRVQPRRCRQAARRACRGSQPARCRQAPRRGGYFSSTSPPASSSSPLSFSASSRSMPSLTALRGVVDERLGLLEAEAGGRAHHLDHLDLLVAGGPSGRRRRCSTPPRPAPSPPRAAGRRSGSGDRGRGDAELLLERLDALGELEHRDALQLLDPVLGAQSPWLPPASPPRVQLRARSSQSLARPRRRAPPRPAPRRRALPRRSPRRLGASSSAGRLFLGGGLLLGGRLCLAGDQALLLRSGRGRSRGRRSSSPGRGRGRSAGSR